MSKPTGTSLFPGCSSLRRRAAFLAAAWLYLATSSLIAVAPADLRLEWTGVPSSGAVASPVSGMEGETVTVSYLLRNVGGTDAFAAIVEAHTALGREGRPLRLQPGPAAGATQRRHKELALAQGMGELCLEVHLQSLDAGEPADPRPQDNRICRRVEVVRPQQDRGSVSLNRAPRRMPS